MVLPVVDLPELHLDLLAVLPVADLPKLHPDSYRPKGTRGLGHIHCMLTLFSHSHEQIIFESVTPIVLTVLTAPFSPTGLLLDLCGGDYSPDTAIPCSFICKSAFFIFPTYFLLFSINQSYHLETNLLLPRSEV